MPSQRDLQQVPSTGTRNSTKRKLLWSKQRIRIHVFGMNWADIQSQKGSHFRETEKRLVLESLAASGRIVVHPTPTLSYHARVNVSHMGIQGEWVQGISCSTWTPYAPHACISLALSNLSISAGRCSERPVLVLPIVQMVHPDRRMAAALSSRERVGHCNCGYSRCRLVVASVGSVRELSRT